ncbi:MAG: hypothetical protein KAZ87_09070 [Spirochaetes bacterium]|nr:hypothetical protein [Spirochaetota bacterium]
MIKSISVESSNIEVFEDENPLILELLNNSDRRVILKQDNVSSGDMTIIITAIIFTVQASISGIIGSASWEYIKGLIGKSLLTKTKKNQTIKYYVETQDNDGRIVRQKLIISGNNLKIDLPNGSKIKIK